MNVLLRDELLSVKSGIIGQCAFVMKREVPMTNILSIEKGFFFIYVVDGKADISGLHDTKPIHAGDLIVLTPSMTCKIHDSTLGFRISCVYIIPDFFDSLSGGQLLYNQLTGFIGNGIFPVIHLEIEEREYLQNTFALFTGQLIKFHLYQNGIVRHLCEVLLLQVTDILYQKSICASPYIKRSHEIFRRFRKMLMDNYKIHHDIGFYAGSLNISTTYLSRIVKNITGKTVRFHVAELICADARKLLESTNMSIKEIATVLGFSDQSVFGKFFIARMGVSPLKFRFDKPNVKD